MSKEPFHPRDAMNASEAQLTQWVSKLPHPNAKEWRQWPFPLFRALQLQNPVLFGKWLDWGCSLTAATPFRNVLKRMAELEERTITALMKKDPDVLHYIAQRGNRLEMEICLEVLSKEYPQGFDQISLAPLLHKSGCDDSMFSDMAMSGIVHGGFNPNDLLVAVKGELRPSKRWALSYTDYAEWRWREGTCGITQTEHKIYDRINHLETGVIKGVDVTPLLEMGMLVAAYAFKQHLVVNDTVEQLQVERKNLSWQRMADTLAYNLPHGRQMYSSAAQRFTFTSSQWIEMFDSLFEDVLDIRMVDNDKHTVFNFLHRCPQLPEEVRLHIAKKAWDTKPALVHLKGRRSQKSFLELTEKTTCAVRQQVESWALLAKFDNTLRHQTNKNTTEKYKGDVVAPRRRM